MTLVDGRDTGPPGNDDGPHVQENVRAATDKPTDKRVTEDLTAPALTVPDIGLVELLDLLDYTDDEPVAICIKPIGGTMRTEIHTRASAVAAAVAAAGDVYFGVNPVDLVVGTTGKRGAAADVTRLAALLGDFDVKDGACPDLATAYALIDDVSGLIGTLPVAITRSGSGLHAYWAVERCSAVALSNGDAAALSRRFGYLVAAVADRRRVKLDTVSDLSRVLRVPATFNCKDPAHPVAVTTVAGGGAPLTVEEITDRLDELGITAPDTVGAEVISDPSRWAYGARWCAYGGTTTQAWATDTPRNGRHPMLVDKLTRLACMRRNGCIPGEAELRGAIDVVARRHAELRAATRETVGSYEISSAWAWAQDCASRKTDDQVDAELGNHRHDDEVLAVRPGTPVVANDVPGTSFATAIDGDVGEGHSGQVRMAYRLAKHYANRIRHVHGLGWMYFNGKHWVPDEIGKASRAVLDVLRKSLAESLSDKELRADVRRCESGAGIAGVLAIAASLPEFATTIEELDGDPWLLNCANGTLDLRTLERSPHRAADLITKSCRAAHDPNSPTTGAWRAFLEQVLPDEEVRRYIQRLMGVALLGKVVEHVLAILTGTGFNGKSKFIEAVLYALGDYGTACEPDLFMHRVGAHPTGEMDLLGRRVAAVSESEEGRQLAVATMKRLTGGDRIKARRMRQDFVEFDPSHTPLLVTNHLPVISGGGESVWGRIRVIPFDVFIGEQERDPHLGDKLAADADAVLAWAVQGWEDYTAHGLNEPPAVLVRTDDYRVDSDAFARFFADECDISIAVGATTGALFAAWKRWAAVEGLPDITQRAFGKQLDVHGYPVSNRTAEGRWRSGIAIKQGDE